MNKKAMIIIAAVVFVLVAAVIIHLSLGDNHTAPEKPSVSIAPPELVAPNGGEISSWSVAESSNETQTENNPSNGSDSPNTDESSRSETGNNTGDSTALPTESLPGAPVPSTPPATPSTEPLEHPTQPVDQNAPTDECTVVFMDKDETVLEQKIVSKGSSVLPPQAPNHEGYTFARWDKSLKNIRSDQTIRAIYQEVVSPTIAVENIYIDATQKTATVSVSIHQNPGIASLFLNISYDHHLTLEKVEYNKAFGDYVTSPEPYSSPQNICMVSPFKNITEDGVFATLTFSIGGISDLGSNGKISIHLGYDQENTFNVDYEDEVFSVVDGSITVIQ